MSEPAALIDRALAPEDPGPDDTRGRIMLAALRQCEEVGLRRTTMEDIARRAGLARVTLYRHFASKEALVQAVVLAEADRFFAALDEAIAPYPALEDRLVEGFAFALEFVRRHALLRRLLDTEPESLIPHLVGDSPLIPTAREGVAARIGHAERPETQVLAELVVRLLLSLALSPDTALELDTPQQAREFARRFLVAVPLAG